MRKIIVSIIVLMALLITVSKPIKAQDADTLKRTAGFFFSPGVTGVHDLRDYPAPESSYGFGLSGGYRTTYNIGKGFFLEGGFTLSSFEWNHKAQMHYWLYDAYGNYTTYMTPLVDVEEKFVDVSAPFLAGYRTTKGKVRFVGALGYSFNLQIWHSEKTDFSAYNGYYHDDKEFSPTFGPNLAAIARAGISVPFAKGRGSIDIMPTARYTVLNFNSGKMDLLQTVTNDFRPWSVGLDVGISMKLKDKKKVEYQHQGADNAFTFAPSGDSAVAEKPKKDHYRNFIYIEMAGNGGIFSANYERNVFHGRKIGLNARAGFGMLPEHYAFPVGVNLAIGDTPRKFEIGLGATFENFTQNGGFGESGDLNINVVPSLGIRIESQRHFFFRASAMCHYITTTGELWPGIGLAFGGAF